MKHAPSVASSHDNGQSMMIPSQVWVMLCQLQRSGHGYSSLSYETCSVSCHRHMITYRALLIILNVQNMLYQLPRSQNNCQSMVMYPQVWVMLRQLPPSHAYSQSMEMYSSVKKHAPSVFIVSWQRSEHGNVFLMYEACTVSCHRLLTTVRAWSCITQVWNMLRQLTSSHDNGQGMVIYPSSMKHALSVVIV